MYAFVCIALRRFFRRAATNSGYIHRQMTLVIAHRGASSTHRENTLEAFIAAQEQGADWVELDVRGTVDGVVVVHHDALLPDKRLIAAMRAHELPEFVPTLSQAIEACGSMGMNVEIKNSSDDLGFDPAHAIAADVAGVLSRTMPSGGVIVSSFNESILAKLRSVDEHLPAAWLVDNETDLFRATALCHSLRLQAIHPHHELANQQTILALQKAQLRVNVWTVDDSIDMSRLLEWQVDGIVTNAPSRLRSLIDAH